MVPGAGDAEAADSADASPFDAADPSLGTGNTFLLSVPEELLDDIFNSVNSVKNVTNVGVVPPSVVLPTLPPPTFSSQEGGSRPRPRPQTQRRSQASSRTTSRTRTQTSRRRTQSTSQQRNQSTSQQRTQNSSQQRGNQNISQQRRNQSTAQQRTPNTSQQRRTQNASQQRRGQGSRSQSNPDTTRTGLRGQAQVPDDGSSRWSVGHLSGGMRHDAPCAGCPSSPRPSSSPCPGTPPGSGSRLRSGTDSSSSTSDSQTNEDALDDDDDNRLEFLLFCLTIHDYHNIIADCDLLTDEIWLREDYT